MICVHALQTYVFRVKPMTRDLEQIKDQRPEPSDLSGVQPMTLYMYHRT